MDGKQDIPSIERIAELQQLIANFAEVLRMPKLANTGRRENDVDHSYGLALTCWFLASKVAPKLDLAKILQYALAHDIVEIYSGDTYVFDEAAVKTKSRREDKALKRLQAEWPDFPELTDAAEKYKEKADPEARFVYTIDKMLPSIMINLGEKEAYWRRHKVTKQMETDEKKKKMTTSPEALPYLDLLLEWMSDPNYFYKPD